jgi:Glu-tRNA(Gln) amidotransferase subunit E-like FAD-binding protein
VDALDGVPHETRQPFADGRTDFERILPGPDRMYPDTDSPPTRVTRERVSELRSGLPQRPWEREQRYGAAGVPQPTVHYLIRRNGASLVDRVVTECGADLRQACFFFGERLKGLRRSGVAVDGIPAERWCEFFRAAAALPQLWQAWQEVACRLAQSPGTRVAEILSGNGFGAVSGDWAAQVSGALSDATRAVYDGDQGRLERLAMGMCMRILRGKVPAAEVAAALCREIDAGGLHDRR